jgi:site-specific DNA-adenine methylase
MFSFFGSKSKIVHRYPRPSHHKVIEPFAGSARYALLHWECDVLLVDKYEVVVDVWHWLQKCSERDILGLPRLSEGERLSDITSLSREERLFMGFMIAPGNATPCNKVSPFGDWENRRNPNFYRNVAKNLEKIRHWDIRLGNYTEIQNQEATWFVDPPYSQGGRKYTHHAIDYASLSAWCQERMGQVIVCENAQAGWLPFKPLTKMRGANTISQEMMWTNSPQIYQGGLF